MRGFPLNEELCLAAWEQRQRSILSPIQTLFSELSVNSGQGWDFFYSRSCARMNCKKIWQIASIPKHFLFYAIHYGVCVSWVAETGRCGKRNISRETDLLCKMRISETEDEILVVLRIHLNTHQTSKCLYIHTIPQWLRSIMDYRCIIVSKLLVHIKFRSFASIGPFAWWNLNSSAIRITLSDACSR